MINDGICRFSAIRHVKGFPIFSEKEPSEEFIQALTTGGPDHDECGFCQRQHFSLEYRPEPGDAARFERLKIRAKNQRNRGEYVFHDSSSLSVGDLGFRTFVADCPCNAAVHWEEMFLRNRRLIAEYFTNRAESRKAEAEKLLQAAEAVTR